MSIIRVHIKDKYTLVLDEDAKKGDEINLREITNVDTSDIEEAIRLSKDNTYNDKLNEQKNFLKASYDKELIKVKADSDEAKLKEIEIIKEDNRKKIAELNAKIIKLEESRDSIILLEKQKLEASYEAKIQELENKLNTNKITADSNLELKEKEVENKYIDKVNALNNRVKELEILLDNLNKSKDNIIELEISKKLTEINEEVNQKEDKYKDYINKLNLEHINELNNVKVNITKEKEELINKLQLELDKANINTQNQLLKKEKELTNIFNEEKDKYNQEKDALVEKLNLLQREKASLNVKRIGEDLEKWCSTEYLKAAQTGFLNCTWTKDNTVVKNEGDVKGSKADFIFDIYLDENKEDLLTNVCLEMKDENPDSVNKHTDSSYFKKLDENRKKKNCKYALLVSNLESDNDLPIYKVLEYKDMYVVRPAYMLTFLNIINSLTLCYSSQLKLNIEKKADIQVELDFIAKLDELVNTYLDKPLEALKKEIDTISTCANNITEQANKIRISIDNINRKYIDQIEKKLSKFEAESGKIVRKVNKK